MPKPPTVILNGPCEKGWAQPSPDNFVEQPGATYQAPASRGIGKAESGLRGSFIAKAPSLVSLLRDQEITALIAINDQFARKYYFWARVLGIEFPRHLSIVAFDNLTDNTPYPLSSIDFGFERLGYLSAHILIGDISVPTDRGGNIPGIPTLVDRGSIARPGDRRILKQLLQG
jgi:DNA-binding LacI/PurR family transcriptional regulator